MTPHLIVVCVSCDNSVVLMCNIVVCVCVKHLFGWCAAALVHRVWWLVVHTVCLNVKTFSTPAAAFTIRILEHELGGDISVDVIHSAERKRKRKGTTQGTKEGTEISAMDRGTHGRADGMVHG